MIFVCQKRRERKRKGLAVCDCLIFRNLTIHHLPLNGSWQNKAFLRFHTHKKKVLNLAIFLLSRSGWLFFSSKSEEKATFNLLYINSYFTYTPFSVPTKQWFFVVHIRIAYMKKGKSENKPSTIYEFWLFIWTCVV